MKKKLLIAGLLILGLQMGIAQEKIILYPNGAPESNEIAEDETLRDPEFLTKISEARMYGYFAPEALNNGTAVLICPGGGYSGVAFVKEGEEIAKWFNALGVNAFVLYYRMPNGHHDIPLKDAKTALEIIHKQAKSWGINKKKIGIMGFSAGGHLAATAATHLKAENNRPDFAILGYPVITMQEGLTHGGSRQNLLGQNPEEDLVNLYSCELQVSIKTPPAFLFHAEDDKVVPIQNSLMFVEALKSKKIPVELYSFPKGGHGFGMRPTNPETDKWPERLQVWMKKQKFIK
ncbi:MAG: alpha/beta hydrolase [Bacteroidales bacterium]|jgi:acetyl esterase/lipase|nr:alpha/beta hydrolase [Bacteroidales bacterium]